MDIIGMYGTVKKNKNKHAHTYLECQSAFITKLWAKGEIIIQYVLEAVQISLNTLLELLTIGLHSESLWQSEECILKIGIMETVLIVMVL